MDALGKFGEHSEKLELLSAAPRATLTHLSCSPNFLRASITRYTHAKREQILNFHMTSPKFKQKKQIIDSSEFLLS